MEHIPPYASLLVLIVGCVVIGIDIFLALNGVKGDTYSEVIRAWARRRLWLVMLVCFAMGTLAGHFFWTECSPLDCQELCRHVW